MRRRLEGKVALVTGGSRGIGFAVASALVSEGVKVGIVGRDAAQLAAAQSKLTGEDAVAVAICPADVGHFDAVDHAVATVVEQFGGIDVLVNNAGVGIFTPVADMSSAQWSAVIDTNLTGVFNCCRAVIPHLRARGGGDIVNVSSLAGKNAFVGGGAYCASKAALNAFSEVLMQELRYDGIRVTYVMPGSVATSFSGDETKGAAWKSSADEVALAVLSVLHMPPRSTVSRLELRPSKPARS